MNAHVTVSLQVCSFRMRCEKTLCFYFCVSKLFFYFFVCNYRVPYTLKYVTDEPIPSYNYTRAKLRQLVKAIAHECNNNSTWFPAVVYSNVIHIYFKLKISCLPGGAWTRNLWTYNIMTYYEIVTETKVSILAGSNPGTFNWPMKRTNRRQKLTMTDVDSKRLNQIASRKGTTVCPDKITFFY